MKESARAQANRRNAQRSTGPRTEAGKRRVSGNAFRHGLAVTPLQSQAGLASIELIAQQIIRDASDAVETEIAHRIALAHFETIRARQARNMLWLNLRDPYDLDLNRYLRDEKKVFNGTASPDVADRWFIATLRFAKPGLTALDLLEDTIVEK